MANIRIDIASEFKDRGFKQADKATTALNRRMVALGKTLAATLSTRAIYQFSKASVRAFSEDQQAAVRLTKSLENLGLAFENTRVTKFVSELEAASGVLDDSLRPAMQSLLMTTGSVARSQELLNLALEMSRASGMDVAAVSKDLARAYVGQTRGLAKYNIGLSQVELRTKSFADLQQILTEQFSGQNAAYLETYAGKVGVLNVAYANMQETIGQGLVDAFTILSGDSGIAGGTKAMGIFAEKVADTTRGVAALISSFSSLKSYAGTVFQFFKSFDPFAPWSAITELGKQKKPLFFPTGGMGSSVEEKARAKAEREAAKRAKQLAELQKKSATAQQKAALAAAKREKEQQQLKRAGTVFDMENIQIVAALQNKVTDEQRLRLTALLAINNDNAEAAEKLTLAILASNAAAFEALGVTMKAGDNVETLISKIVKAQASLYLVSSGITTIPKAKNPFEDWPDIIAGILAGISSVNNAINGITGGGAGGGTGGGGGAGGGVTNGNPGAHLSIPGSGNNFIVPDDGGGTFVPIVPIPVPDSGDLFMGDDNGTIGRGGNEGIASITINIGGSVVTENDIVASVTNAIYNRQKSGQTINYSTAI